MIKIKVSNNTNKFIHKCINNNINLYKINYYNNYITCNISKNKMKEILKYKYISNITIINYTGIDKILNNIKKYYYDLIMLLMFFILIFIESNIIIDIDIKYSKKDINIKTKNILKEYGIKKYTLKKNNKELTSIANKIQKNNKDFIDYISIKRKGMKYIVNLEERIINDIKDKDKYCNVVANKDGIINKIEVVSGESLLEKGSYFHKGDILISGEVIFNDEIKENVCAKGKILATTWYKIKVNYPRIKSNKIFTKREKINIKIKNKYLKKINYKLYDEELIYKIHNYEILKQKEYIIDSYNLSNTKLKEESINEAINKILKNKNIIKINDKKVLNSYINNSKIELEIFISTNEYVGEDIVIEVGDTNDTNKSI